MFCRDMILTFFFINITVEIIFVRLSRDFYIGYDKNLPTFEKKILSRWIVYNIVKRK